MKINQNKDGKKLEVFIEGRIDSGTAPDFNEYIKGAMVGVEELILDLKDVDYISSAGLRVILFAQKTMNSQGSLLIRNVNSDIMETFELTGFTDILTIK